MEQKWKICSMAEFPVSFALVSRFQREEAGESKGDVNCCSPGGCYREYQ
jgi:hypothetical protein